MYQFLILVYLFTFHVPNDELQPHMIRACIDLRVPNKFIERNRKTQGPVVEDVIYKFHECVVFSKLDLRSGYHQFMLHPDSRTLFTLHIRALVVVPCGGPKKSPRTFI